jgi:hypothetical protein
MTRSMLVSVVLLASIGLASAQTSSSSAGLTAEQRARIHDTLAAQKVEPARNLNIQVSVGAIVPKTATLHPLPQSIVQIQPAWRDHMYLVAGDEIVIVEPRSLRVVALLPD